MFSCMWLHFFPSCPFLSLHSLPEPFPGCPSPVTHLRCRVPLQHSRDGFLQHLSATILKWNRKEGITIGPVKRTPEEMIHPMVGLCPTASPSQRWSGPGTTGCRAVWGEKGLGASEEGPHTSLLLLFAGKEAPQPPPHLQAMGQPWPHNLEQRSGTVWAQGTPVPGA